MDITRELAERLCKVAPERFAFAVVDGGWYSTFTLQDGDCRGDYEWSLANHLKQFEDTILYASAWALNEMKERLNVLDTIDNLSIQQDEEYTFLWEFLVNENLRTDPVRVLEEYAQWGERYKEAQANER